MMIFVHFTSYYNHLQVHYYFIIRPLHFLYKKTNMKTSTCLISSKSWNMVRCCQNQTIVIAMRETYFVVSWSGSERVTCLYHHSHNLISREILGQGHKFLFCSPRPHMTDWRGSGPTTRVVLCPDRPISCWLWAHSETARPDSHISAL